MTPKKGIDVSVFQKNIDWQTVKPNIDFAILRAGYGRNAIDSTFMDNASACNSLGIPIGAYWFSYAYNVKQANDEANYICDIVQNYRIEYPIIFDYEYDSENYARNKGYNITPDLMSEMANTFLERVKSRGYTPMLYTNPDYINRGFKSIYKKYPLWLAQWNTNKPQIDCDIWQYSSSGAINGIKGNVDLNFCYVNNWSTDTTNNSNSADKFNDIKEQYWEIYKKLADQVLEGKWGAGKERAVRLHAEGYDYNYVQAIVNKMVL